MFLSLFPGIEALTKLQFTKHAATMMIFTLATKILWAPVLTNSYTKVIYLYSLQFSAARIAIEQLFRMVRGFLVRAAMHILLGLGLVHATSLLFYVQLTS
jgi:hypothetical protein